jgi:hypothetical protein
VWDITSAPVKQVPAGQNAPLQLKKYNYFNFAESKREAEESERTLPRVRLQASKHIHATSTQGRRTLGVREHHLEEEEEEQVVEEEGRRRKQATASTRRMPRRSRPMKDAETGETFRGSCIQAKSPEIPNGATPPE